MLWMNLNDYFCAMITKRFILLFLALFAVEFCSAQAFIRTEELMRVAADVDGGELVIDQDPAIDSLLGRAILANKEKGITGVRVQIFYSSVRNAHEEASLVRAKFISKFPNIYSEIKYQNPGWYKVVVGNYRSKIEAYKDFLSIKKEFPNCYMVNSEIESPYKN